MTRIGIHSANAVHTYHASKIVPEVQTVRKSRRRRCETDANRVLYT